MYEAGLQTLDFVCGSLSLGSDHKLGAPGHLQAGSDPSTGIFGDSCP